VAVPGPVLLINPFAIRVHRRINKPTIDRESQVTMHLFSGES
jgi:hypothetical protein